MGVNVQPSIPRAAQSSERTIPSSTRVTSTSVGRRIAPVLAALAIALALAVLGGYAAWQLHNATGVTYSHAPALGKDAGDDYDEGAYVTSARLLLRGYPLFKTVFSAQPAFFLPTLAGVVRVVSNPVAAGHIYEALCGILALLGVIWMAWTAYRPLAAPLGALLLAVSPGFLLYSHAVESEMPMLALCTLSVAAAQSYYLNGWRTMAALAGLLLCAGTEMKLLSVVAVPPLALLLLGGAWRRRADGVPWSALLLDLATFVLALAIPAAATWYLLSPADQLRQVVTFHLDAGRSASFGTGDNVPALRVFLGYDPALLLAAAASVVLALLPGRGRDGGRRYLPVVYLLWFLTTLVFLWRYHPTFQHQFVPLLPPLALLGAGLAGIALARASRGAYMDSSGRGWTRGIAPSTGRATTLPPSSRPRRLAPAVPLALLALVGYGALLGRNTVPLDRQLYKPSVTPNRSRLIALVDRVSRPGDFVVTDDPMVVLGANRLLPPGIEDPSMVRIAAGYLTASQAERSTVRYHVAVIVFSRPKVVHGRLVGTVLSHDLPRYSSWVARHYRRIDSPVSGAFVFVRR